MMADCSFEIAEIRFDVRHPELTEVYVFIEARGDCPDTIPGWHFKTYPGTLTSAAIHAKLCSGPSAHNPLLWPRRTPLEGRLAEAGALADEIVAARGV